MKKMIPELERIIDKCNTACRDCPVSEHAKEIASSNLKNKSDEYLDMLWNTFAYCDFCHWEKKQKTEAALCHIEMEQETREKSRQGFVYLMRCGTYYKIGLSKNPTNRLKQLSTIPPFDIEIIHLIKTCRMRLVEKTLHKEFENKRKNGEWFELSKEDVEFVKEIEDDCGFDYFYPQKEI